MTARAPDVTETLRDGSRVSVRPISRRDVELERAFIEGLSPESRRYRFLGSMKSPSEALLRKLTDIDPSTEVAFIALAVDAGRELEVGVARYSANADGSAEIAVTVDDHWQGKGLGTLLMHRLIDVARERGIKRLYSIDAADNSAMRDLAEHLGFSRETDPGDTTQVVHSLNL
jgi:GNAT superfamily N-acetyltransferase